MSRLRKNLSLSPLVLNWAHQIMRSRGFDELSEFVSTLIREEWDRRTLLLRDAPPSLDPHPISPHAKPARPALLKPKH